MRHRERRPTAVLQFTTVEEPGAVVSRARAIAARQRSASNPALPLPLTGLTDPPSASTHTGAVFDEVGCTQRARASSLDISSTATDVAQRMSAPSALVQLATTALPPLASRVLDWDPDEEADQQDWEDFGSDACSSLSSTGRQWHSHSVDGSHTAAGTDWERSGGKGVPDSDQLDPTVSMAVALGLDPLKLPLFGGAGGRAGTPGAAIKALRSALTRPTVSPCLEALLLRQASGSTLRRNSTAASKQLQAAGGSLEGQVGRVQTIDALLLAMTRRLGAVKEAMSSDAAQQKAQQQQRGLQAAEAPTIGL
ncbi:hypothetical protein D9Q98_001299 [Chlorella vulgaris]|uniref:Uncharacterized protein n=1 Tax=Chlorella vulgaris TaxID=3077 RepID=A0A9D4U0Z2_CHLVU|nr:hypothetical protein D9Q98_001299 [Chlorella vulgaris]